MSVTDSQAAQFNQQGFLIFKQAVQTELLQQMQQVARQQLIDPQQPYELETTLGYPGAPESLTEHGGSTIRRLLGAYSRSSIFADWATSEFLKNSLQTLFNKQPVYLSQAHHNSLMTKAPRFSSDTGWHQDIRYWSFAQPRLISVWLALGKESAQNGGLWVVPGSHQIQLQPEQFGEQTFFRSDLPQNKTILDTAVAVELEPGDVLFFDSRLLHRASRNHTDEVKFSLVFSYHDADNHPLVGTRSNSMEEICL